LKIIKNELLYLSKIITSGFSTITIIWEDLTRKQTHAHLFNATKMGN